MNHMTSRTFPSRLLIVCALTIFLISGWITSRSYLAPNRYNVIILTVESLRADRIDSHLTPHLLDISSLGYRFHNHRAISGWTGTNIVSILTGLSPFDSGVHTRGQSVRETVSTSLEELEHHGYTVEGIQGFMAMDIYRNLGLTVRPQSDDPLYWLALHKQKGDPFLLWYHYVHTHLPYNSTDGYATEVHHQLSARRLPEEQHERLELVATKGSVHFEKATYLPEDIPFIHTLQAATIREFDDWFNDFWTFFSNSGLRQNTVLIVTADHGDEHGERGMVGHASTTQLGHLHEEIVRVPLFIWVPPQLQPDTSPDITRMTTHEDLMPTLFGLLGLQPPAPFTGSDIFRDNAKRPWAAITSSGGFAEEDTTHIRYYDHAILEGDMKLMLKITQNGEESISLYNLQRDPAEVHNIAALSPDTATRLTKKLKDQIDTRTRLPAYTETEQTSPAAGTVPTWTHPSGGKVFSYKDMNNKFSLEWSGTDDGTYILEYIAGKGSEELRGSLKVEGSIKDFGKISSRYWQTWVVPNSPIRLRVRQENSMSWSDWLELEAIP